MSIDFNWPIQQFWLARERQTNKQTESGRVDAGLRGAVTGGKHLEPLQDAVASLFADPELPDIEIRKSGRISLPGYYRRSKDWDLVVVHRGTLVAAIEFKSQVGPSFGNNFNNRTEESIGNAVDVWRAYEEGLFGSVRPWLGFIMIIERAQRSQAPLVRDGATIYPPDPIFDRTSYIDRYRILMQRLVRERLYDAAAVISTESGRGIFDEPIPELSMANFSAAVTGRMAYIKGVS